MMMVHCAGCDRPIQDRFLLNVLDCAWHANCVQCSDCKGSLTEKCFSRDGKLYCREDFFRRFGTKCAGCSTGISPSDLVRKAKDKVFHLKCFTCMVCRKQLSTGEELYVLDENKFVCKYDFINSKLSGSDSEDEGDFDTIPEASDNISEKDFSVNGDESPDTKDNFLPELINNKMSNFDNSTAITVLDIKKEPTDIESAHIDNCDTINNNPGSVGTDGASIKSPVTDIDHTDNLNTMFNSNHSSEAEIPDEDSVSNGNSNSGSKRRGPRTTIKAKQLEVLKSAFNATPKPTRHIREQLAKETGLNMRVIQVWFQNRRSKERRMKQLSALGARRHFFRNPRRMRGPGMSPDDSPDMMGPPGFGYFPEDNPEFCGYQGFNDFFPGQEGHNGMGYLTPPPGHHPMHMEQTMMSMGTMGSNPEEQFMPHDMSHHPSATPPMSADMPYNSDRLALSQSLAPHHPDLISKAW